jgi:hypothetical protein
MPSSSTANKSFAQRIVSLGTVGVLVFTVSGILPLSGCSTGLGSGGELAVGTMESLTRHVDNVAIHQSTIATIDYSSALTYELEGQSHTAALEAAPIGNNFFKNNTDGVAIGIDTTAMETVINANIAWVNLSNGVDTPTAEQNLRALLTGDDAFAQFQSKNKGSQVAFSTLSVGEVRMQGNTVHLLTHEKYALAANGMVESLDYKFSYTLELVDGELKIAAMQAST